ncbi:twin-arginine translocation signal domain-containing protein [Xanthomonas campestris pv. campestris]|nr:twin-arginine translocation signal domain-containing protein [Xanthomonas campestris pv. campestris]MEB1424404.1 twin-arginine translocation signal domain-containing protein [Xanthomonas campestris pv. campestris]MEB1449353.1 twin-arginine translocation signal domain-containing protein [Xanthomonas campestris pv. campestris]
MGNRRGFLKMSASLAAAPLIPESSAVSNELGNL